MTPGKLFKAITLPLTDGSVLLVTLLFTVLMSIASAALGAGIFIGYLIVLFSLPPVFRYQMAIVEACARDQSPGALDAENFNWVGGGYAFFPLALAFLFVLIGFYASASFGIVGVISSALLTCILYPAALALLAITRSPLQSINPVAVVRLYTKSDHLFWIAPIYFGITAWLSILAQNLPMPVANFLQLFFMFSLAALSGALIAQNRLVDEVDIPEPVAPLRSETEADLHSNRTHTLTHAYGFISRNNRQGGFRHVIDEIARDPDPAGAWMWYFERMQKWDEPQHAMFFAQHVIRDNLQHGETVPALKMLLRCHMQNEQFRPFREDIPALLEAAETGDNTELAAVLKAM